MVLQIRVGGKQVQKRLGPAWIVGGPPPDGYFTKKTAEAELAAILTDARRGALPGLPAVGATVRDATEEWLRHGKCERGIKASTASEYRNVVEAHIVPRFGNWPVRSTKRRSAMRLLSVHRRRPIRSVLASSGKSKSAVRRRRPPHVGLFQPDPWRRDDEELRLHGIRGRGPPPEGHILARTNGG